MLINVFGLWLMASNIIYLNPGAETYDDLPHNCAVEFMDKEYKYFPHSCDEVAAEINKQLSLKQKPKA